MRERAQRGGEKAAVDAEAKGREVDRALMRINEGGANVKTDADARRVGPRALMRTNEGTAPALAEGTASIEPASGTEEPPPHDPRRRSGTQGIWTRPSAGVK